MAEAPLRRYFKLPEDVKTVDFVHQIDRAATAERVLQTLDDYQVTASIERNLAAALDNIRRGLSDKRSVFSWIHGSFGCGKSHFMNVLSLLVADEKAVYSVHSELQAHRKKFHPAVIGRSLFRLHIQCISRGATTLEEVIFGAAVEELARLHPAAPPPALFESQKLFTSARALLNDLGDAKFFGAFPSNKDAHDDDAWGELGGARWSRARFEAALGAPQSKEARDLAGELAKTPWLSGTAASSAFVKLGPGLQILAEHLDGLGYEGVVLFLDELVLWLSTFQDPKKLALEAPKVSTLVEHGDYPRCLPYLTFAARQRDLSEMVGKLAIGDDEVVFRDQLSFWKDRFETISLEDKDLPQIIQKRVLRSAGPEADAEINAAFESYKRSFAQDFRALTGNQGDVDDFRRVYPFSPALIEVMVALSATLQRDRTALRELTNLLVNYLPDFELGKVVPVGDLFDVVAHGQTSDLPAIQRLYEQARQIYDSELLPHIRKKNGTDTPSRCQLLREEFDARRGCSGCAEKSCRAQTRIAKTVLLQGLVPNTPALKELTASSLVYLNSGTLKSRIPNQEPATVTKLVGEWADITTAVHVKGDSNPQVRCVIDRVNVRRILDFCRDLDNEQRRRMRVRDILFEKMGVAQKDQLGARSFDWRGRKWRVGFVYDNVRQANKNVFRPGEGEDLRVVLDYPFDDTGYGPRDDEDVVAQVIEGLTGKDAERGLATVVWLPAFVDEDTRQSLADLVTIEGLVGLRDQDLASRVPFVSMDELPRVKTTLEQQREGKRRMVEEVLESAYGVSHRADARLAPGLAPEQRVYLLRRDAKMSVPVEATFDRALEGVVKQALEARAPRHPAFGKALTKARLEAVLELIDRVLETPERKARFDKAQIEDLRGIAAAEHLGIVRIIEEEATFAGGILDQAAKNLAHHKGPLSAGAVRAALDPDGLMDLSSEVQDFLVLAYAKAAARPLRLLAHGHAVVGLIGKLTDDIALVPVELPGQETWQGALKTAGILGVTLAAKALTPARVDELAGLVKKAASELGAARLSEVMRLLGEWQRDVGISDPAEMTARGSVLGALRELVSAVMAAEGSLGVVEALSRFAWDPARATALTFMAAPKAVDGVLATLKSNSLRTPIMGGRELEADPDRREEAARIMLRVRAALVGDENVEPLRSTLEREAPKIMQMFVERQKPKPAGDGGAGGTLLSTVNLAPKLAPADVPVQAAQAPGPVVLMTKTATPRPAAVRLLLRSSDDMASAVEAIRTRLNSGEQLLITIETAPGDEG